MFFISDEFGQECNYYEQNKAESTIKIQALAVFTKKRYSFIYRQFIYEPSIDSLAVDCFLGQSAGQRVVFVFCEVLEFEAFAGFVAC